VESAKKMAFQPDRGIILALQQQVYEQDTAEVQFSRQIQERVRSGEITTCVRFWKRPQVIAGGHYPLDPGELVITSVREISQGDIDLALAHASGYQSVTQLLQSAQHGTGHHIYVIRFTYRER